jgi:hypothetical protein
MPLPNRPVSVMPADQTARTGAQETVPGEMPGKAADDRTLQTTGRICGRRPRSNRRDGARLQLQ